MSSVPKGNSFIGVSICGKSLQRAEEIRLNDEGKGIGNDGQGGSEVVEVISF